MLYTILFYCIIFNNYPPKWRWLAVDIYRAAVERRGKYLTLVTDTEGDNFLVFAQSVNRYGEFQFWIL